MEYKSNVTEALPFIAMITVEFVQIGLATLSKAAMASGLNQYVYIVYYDALGTIILLPWIVFQNLRMEKLDLRKFSDQIKVLGTIVAVLGAVTVTLYKGPALLSDQQSNWTLGGLLLTLAVLLKSVQNIVQADVAKLYPDEVAFVFFYTLSGIIQTAIASFFMVKGQSEWHLNHKIQIIAVFYAAFSLSVVSTTIITWCLRKKGPVYVSMFTPLNVAIAAVMSFVFLEDNIYLGSVVGSATTVIGFYAVMWARAKTTTYDMVSNNIGCLEPATSSQVTPLLQSSQT